MKRFLVVQLIEMVDNDDPAFRDVGEENVFDADSEDEAETWISKQKNPDSFVVRDTMADDSEFQDEEDSGFYFPTSFASVDADLDRDTEDDWAELIHDETDEEGLEWAD
jgi:hypothetical protein